MKKKNSKQTDSLPPYISSKRSILKTIANELKERIKNESIEAKMPVYKNKWQNDVMSINYDNILSEFIKTGIYEGISILSHNDIIKTQQVFYANVLLKLCEFFDKVMKNYPIAKDKNDFLIKVEYDFCDFLLKSYLWAGIIPRIKSDIDRTSKSNETKKRNEQKKREFKRKLYKKLNEELRDIEGKSDNKAPGAAAPDFVMNDLTEYQRAILEIMQSGVKMQKEVSQILTDRGFNSSPQKVNVNIKWMKKKGVVILK